MSANPNVQPPFHTHGARAGLARRAHAAPDVPRLPRPKSLRSWLGDALAECDLRLGGDQPWDPQVHDERVFRRVLLGGSLALGESYVEGAWDCDRLDELFYRALQGNTHHLFPFLRGAHPVLETLTNRQRPSRAREVAHRHYDLDNHLFELMLGETKQYSCGYWQDASDLGQAQRAKLGLVCAKLGLEPGMRVLDIGCGWGGAARFAAEQHGVEVVGITVSEEQAREARERCRGLPVEIRLEDYRDVKGQFDRIFSIGMFEHVGAKNHRRFLETVHDHLVPDGLCLLHAIGSLRTSASGDPWIDRYIFPNSLLPSAQNITRAAEGLFVIEDWHNFGADYDPTLMAWHRNFETHWPYLCDRYDERFHRLWRYYLLSCAGGFRARVHQLWQIVLSPHGVPGGYRAPR